MSRKKKLNTSELRTRLTLSRQEARENDYILLNNPVFVSGYSMAAAVGGATSLKNALLLAMAGAMLIIPVRIIGDALSPVIKPRIRPAVYVLLSAVICIPVLIGMYNLFGGDAVLLGMYIPLLFMDNLVLFRSMRADREGARLVWNNALSTALGYGIALIIVGSIRELLAKGTLYGRGVIGAGVWPAAGELFGGLIVTASVAALWSRLCSAVIKLTGGDANE